PPAPRIMNPFAGTRDRSPNQDVAPPSGHVPAARSSTRIGWWYPDRHLPIHDPEAIRQAVEDFSRSMLLVLTATGFALGLGGRCSFEPSSNGSEGFPVAGFLPPLQLVGLGDRTFCVDHGLRYPYLAGAMANGIGSAEIVEAMSRAGMLAFFGAAGLQPNTVEAAILRVRRSLGELPFGFNLIHSPNEPALENAVVDLSLRRGVHLVEASAYLDLPLPVVRYRLHGIHTDSGGRIVIPNRVIAKVSRVEVATKFFSPAP